ncbi:MAG: hypothetical protein ACRDJN_29235, partial [Chloroflexota bacterium]
MGVLAGTALWAVVVLGLPSLPGPAYACSGPPWDPSAATVIAEGWIEGIALRPDLAKEMDRALGTSSFPPVELTLRVARVLRGAAVSGQRVTFYDYTSVSREAPRLPDGPLGHAPANACGVLPRTPDGGAIAGIVAGQDPTGMYALVVLVQDQMGRLSANQLWGTSFAARPNVPHLEELRRRIAERLRPPALPHGGDGSLAPSGQTPQPELVITIQPPSGPPGTIVTISGRGAPPSATVRIQHSVFRRSPWPVEENCRLPRHAGLAATVTADAQGRFVARLRAEPIVANWAGAFTPKEAAARQLGITYSAATTPPSPPPGISNLECFT